MPDNTVYGYTYDKNNQLASVSLPGAGEITYPSYTWTRPDSTIFPGGSKQEYRYDPFMRITQITTKDPGQNVLLDYQCTRMIRWVISGANRLNRGHTITPTTRSTA